MSYAKLDRCIHSNMCTRVKARVRVYIRVGFKTQAGVIQVPRFSCVWSKLYSQVKSDGYIQSNTSIMPPIGGKVIKPCEKPY